MKAQSLFSFLILSSLFVACENATITSLNSEESPNRDTNTNKPDQPHTGPTQYECKEERRLGVYVNSSKVKKDYDYLIKDDLIPYKGSLEAEKNYNYYSVSAHPFHGPKATAFEGSYFLYKNKKGIYLNFFFNMDDGGSVDNSVVLRVITSKNKLADSLVLSDDRSEVTEDIDGERKIYEAEFRYWRNTDGAVIGPFESEDFEIEIELKDAGDNKLFGVYGLIKEKRHPLSASRKHLAIEVRDSVDLRKVEGRKITSKEANIANFKKVDIIEEKTQFTPRSFKIRNYKVKTCLEKKK